MKTKKIDNMSDEMNHPEDRRFFIVHFTGLNEEKQKQRGKIHMFVDNGGYVNEEYAQVIAKRDFGLTDVYVYRVNELDKDDFYDFVAEYKPSEDENEDIEINNTQENKQEDLDDYI